VRPLSLAAGRPAGAALACQAASRIERIKNSPRPAPGSWRRRPDSAHFYCGPTNQSRVGSIASQPASAEKRAASALVGRRPPDDRWPSSGRIPVAARPRRTSLVERPLPLLDTDESRPAAATAAAARCGPLSSGAHLQPTEGESRRRGRRRELALCERLRNRAQAKLMISAEN
jgi:hypothetical protein